MSNYNNVFYPLFSVLPTIRARQSDINATAEVGNSATLACDADGFPEPMVTWVQYVAAKFLKNSLVSVLALLFILWSIVVDIGKTNPQINWDRKLSIFSPTFRASR